VKPAPWEHQGISQDDLVDFAPEVRQEAIISSMTVSAVWPASPARTPAGMPSTPRLAKPASSFFIIFLSIGQVARTSYTNGETTSFSSHIQQV